MRLSTISERSEWRRLWDLLRQFEGDPLASLGEAEVVANKISTLAAGKTMSHSQTRCLGT